MDKSSYADITTTTTSDIDSAAAVSPDLDYVGSQQPSARQQDPGNSGAVAVDVVLISDVVYGSNPGVWERLAETLAGLCSAGRDGGGAEAGAEPLVHRRRAVVLQCETSRVEGVLYDLYWEVLRKAGFAWAPLHDRIECLIEGSEVRTWVIWQGE